MEDSTLISQTEEMMKEMKKSKYNNMIYLEKVVTFSKIFPELYKNHLAIFKATLDNDMNIGMLKMLMAQRDRITYKTDTVAKVDEEVSDFFYQMYKINDDKKK